MTTRRPKVPKVTSVGRGHLGNADHEALNVGGFANSISFVVLVRGGNGTPSVSEGPRLPSRAPSLTLGVPIRMAGCPRRRMPPPADAPAEARPELQERGTPRGYADPPRLWAVNDHAAQATASGTNSRAWRSTGFIR